MTETNESQENQNEEEAAVPTMTTVERAEMLLQQDAAIRAKINGGAALDEAVDPSNKEFGPLAHPEQVQMRVAKRAMMLKEGIQPYPVTLDVSPPPSKRSAPSMKASSKRATRPRTWSASPAVCCSCATRAAYASCSCPPATAPRSRA